MEFSSYIVACLVSGSDVATSSAGLLFFTVSRVFGSYETDSLEELEVVLESKCNEGVSNFEYLAILFRLITAYHRRDFQAHAAIAKSARKYAFKS